ncbi:ATP-dependent DNA helicase RecG [Lachnospiraceae bacterium C1.1]|nr:ATP-dependent DNA helicase RecG [Lachnospiraceae bacterium C1.1]
MKLSDNIKKLKGIGEKTTALFNKVGVFSLWDLLNYLPRDFLSYPELSKTNDIRQGETVAAALTIQTECSLIHLSRISVLSCAAADDQGKIRLSWFNSPYLKKMIKPGMTRVFYGKAGVFKNALSIEHPKIYKKEEYQKKISVLEPVYPAIFGLSSDRIRKTVEKAFDEIGEIEDYLPDEIREKYGLMKLYEAFKTLHSPAEKTLMKKAMKRLAFDEFLNFSISINALKEEKTNLKNDFRMKESEDAATIINNLPYKLTGAQERTFKEILSDMQSDRPMNRLVQGDVGSGKTIVALLAMVTVASNGYQSAMMAPTEVLAAQHESKIRKMLEEYGINAPVILLTGSLTAKQKREAKEKIASGEVKIVVGTQALIQEDVEFKNLALVVTDEQHRFGVRQRQTLSDKAGEEKDKLTPHVLVMSATPIPRTLAIILYGDLDISIMDELPQARKPIKNCVVGINYRKKAYEFIEKEVAAGHQAYIICPQVEASEVTESENVTDYTEMLKNIYGSRVRVEMLHGKMPPKKKNEIMERFAAHEIDLLVSTTVIEVGVDVPNSTVMMIENAEKFGLAQLHQIRGRVGRGSAQGYCIFVNASKKAEDNKRLSILNDSNDGFKIASEDLKLRGPGDFFGIRQSGEMDFRVADIYEDADMLKYASEYAKTIDSDSLERLNAFTEVTSKKGLIVL